MIEYITLPSPKVKTKHTEQAKCIVDAAFADGYFDNHLNEIDCAWVALDDDKAVGWAAVSECGLRCIAVHPDYRGQGIGRTLTEKRLKHLGDCDSVISYAWVRPDGTCMSCKNLENFGFKFTEELDDHYSGTRIKCKHCGTDCSCIARLYLKES